MSSFLFRNSWAVQYFNNSDLENHSFPAKYSNLIVSHITSTNGFLFQPPRSQSVWSWPADPHLPPTATDPSARNTPEKFAWASCQRNGLPSSTIKPALPVRTCSELVCWPTCAPRKSTSWSTNTTTVCRWPSWSSTPSRSSDQLWLLIATRKSMWVDYCVVS